MGARKQIRNAIQQRLLAANTAAGANVFTSRARPILEILQRREAVLSVYTADEDSKTNPDGYLMDRKIMASIEGAAGGGDDLDDFLDDLTDQVEAVINDDPTLGGLLSADAELVSTSSEIVSRGNVQIGAFRMDYECRYLTERGVDAHLGPEPPIPTQVNTTLTPTPRGYVEKLDDADRRATDPSGVFGREPEVAASEVRDDVLAPSRSVETPRDPGLTDAWTGDQP